MSRVAKKPVTLPKGVDVAIGNSEITIKGAKGALKLDLHPDVDAVMEDSQLKFSPKSESRSVVAMTGTMRSIAANMVHGVSTGFEKKLTLIGVGYRAQAQGNILNLTLGFSHPIAHQIPDGITVETPSQTEIVLKGADKQVIGQVASQIRAYRPPEPYKGKGVRYSDENVVRKEAKKK